MAKNPHKRSLQQQLRHVQVQLASANSRIAAKDEELARLYGKSRRLEGTLHAMQQREGMEWDLTWLVSRMQKQLKKSWAEARYLMRKWAAEQDTVEALERLCADKDFLHDRLLARIKEEEDREMDRAAGGQLEGELLAVCEEREEVTLS